MHDKTAERLNCSCCGSRDVTESHVGRCRRRHAARTEAEAHGALQAIPSGIPLPEPVAYAYAPAGTVEVIES